MTSRLDRITDWSEKAKSARYHAAALAAMCHVTKRQLRRYFPQKFRTSLHAWLIEERFRQAQSLLAKGAPYKEVADETGFKYRENFSRWFNQYNKAHPTADLGGKSGRKD